MQRLIDGQWTTLTRYSRAASNIGICTTVPQATDADTVADIAAHGCRLVRFDAGWYYMESTKGSISWSQMDTAVDTVTAAGMAPLLVIHTTPTWASGESVDTYAPATTEAIEGYANFCAALANRYGHRVAAYEIWNEANLTAFWKPTPNVADYINLASRAAAAIRAVDPTLNIISMGIGGAGNAPDIGINDWLAEFYARGGHAWFDGIGVHSYSSDGGLWEVSRVMAYMNDAGDARPVWLTETGAPSSASAQNGTTEAGQATVVTNCVTNFNQYAGSVGGAIVYFMYEDSGTDPSDLYGIIRRSDGTEKPAAATFDTAAVNAGFRPFTRA